MPSPPVTSSAEESTLIVPQHLRAYYRFQSRIYDLTRWSFLFGRRRALQQLPISPAANISILEVGCGTGHNLVALAKYFPNAYVTGIDLSEDMLAIAAKKVTRFDGRVILQEGAFGVLPLEQKYDLIVFSYCLTMVNPDWDKLLEVARKSLPPTGMLTVVDFHDSAFPFFQSHMKKHHVRMDAHLLPVLVEEFEPVRHTVKSAYGGLWRWFHFVGRRK